MQATASLSDKAARLLASFTDESDKIQGVADPQTFERFCKFVAVAHAENSSLDHETLYRHLQERAWSAEQADLAAKRYKAARLLLSIYDQHQAGTLAI